MHFAGSYIEVEDDDARRSKAKVAGAGGTRTRDKIKKVCSSAPAPFSHSRVVPGVSRSRSRATLAASPGGCHARF